MILVLDTSAANAAIPGEWPVLLDGIAGDVIWLRLLREVAARADQQRPVLIHRVRGDEQLLSKSNVGALVALPSLVPLTLAPTEPRYMVDADGSTPYVLPCDGRVTLAAVSVGAWTYDVQAIRGPDRDRISALDALKVRALYDEEAAAALVAPSLGPGMRQAITGRRAYRLTIAAPSGAIPVTWLPMGCTGFRVQTNGTPATVRRTYGASTQDEVVSSGQFVPLGNCGAFELRGVAPLNLQLEIETR